MRIDSPNVVHSELARNKVNSNENKLPETTESKQQHATEIIIDVQINIENDDQEKIQDKGGGTGDVTTDKDYDETDEEEEIDDEVDDEYEISEDMTSAELKPALPRKCLPQPPPPPPANNKRNRLRKLFTFTSGSSSKETNNITEPNHNNSSNNDDDNQLDSKNKLMRSHSLQSGETPNITSNVQYQTDDSSSSSGYHPTESGIHLVKRSSSSGFTISTASTLFKVNPPQYEETHL